MRVVDKTWRHGTYKAFQDVPEELLQFTPGCRVQPAPYVGKKQWEFYLINRFEPGENDYYPDGGFEVRGKNSVKYAFELDQVILYIDDKTLDDRLKEKKTKVLKAAKSRKRK